MIKIQKNDFSIDLEINKIKTKYKNVGAINNLIGYVRNTNKNKKVNSIYLEVYIKMANITLNQIIEKSKKKWDIIDCLIIHRYGKLKVGDKIVMVATLAKHRKESFLSCEYIMNYLKKDAPFWKKEIYKDKFKWIENTRLKN